MAAAGGILALRAFGGSGDSLVSMVPSDTALYVNVNFDPPASQKLAVQGLLNKFPALSDQSRGATINGWLDTAFSPAGLNHNDISPWLGSELSIAIPASALSSLTPSAAAPSTSSPDVAVLIASKDDAKAQAALDKFRSGPVGRAEQWTTSAHNGVTVTSATGNGSGGAYAIANHTVIFASTSAAADAVIDTAQGKRANLLSSATFKTVEAQLPSDRLGLIYVDVPALVARLGSSLGSVAGGQAQLGAAQAYGGLGVALVARSDGIEVDGTENYNASKLTADQRTQLGIAPHTNGSLAYVPRTALGLFALTGLQQTLKSVLTTVAPAGSAIDSTLQQFGVTGSGGIITHLGGDAGIEVDQVPGQTLPAGALLFDTDSTAAAQTFLDNLMSAACRQSSACDPIADHQAGRQRGDDLVGPGVKRRQQWSAALVGGEQRLGDHRLEPRRGARCARQPRLRVDHQHVAQLPGGDEPCGDKQQRHALRRRPGGAARHPHSVATQRPGVVRQRRSTVPQPLRRG